MPRRYQGVEFAESLPRVTAAAIRNAENQLGVVFPDDYRAFLLAVNGGVPTPLEFAMAEPGRPGERICIDFFYGVGATREENDLVYEQGQIAEQTDSPPVGFVPIGFDPGAAPYFIGTTGERARSTSTTLPVFSTPEGRRSCTLRPAVSRTCSTGWLWSSSSKSSKRPPQSL